MLARFRSDRYIDISSPVQPQSIHIRKSKGLPNSSLEVLNMPHHILLGMAIGAIGALLADSDSDDDYRPPVRQATPVSQDPPISKPVQIETVVTTPTEDGKYYGLWKQGLKQGWGDIISLDRSMRYIGQFDAGQPHGYGHFYFKVGQLEGQYHGMWVQGRRQGHGVLITSPDNTTYDGTWTDSYQGYGVVTRNGNKVNETWNLIGVPVYWGR